MDFLSSCSFRQLGVKLIPWRARWLSVSRPPPSPTASTGPLQIHYQARGEDTSHLINITLETRYCKKTNLPYYSSSGLPAHSQHVQNGTLENNPVYNESVAAIFSMCLDIRYK